MTVRDRLAAHRFVTDGGLETDLIFHHDADLPEFAAYPLLADDAGSSLLADYYAGYARIAAARPDRGLLLEAPTWRASADWGARLGHDAAHLREVNARAIEFLGELAGRWRDDVADVLVGGMIGPRDDAYRAAHPLSADESADYHRAQVSAFAAAGADLAHAMTLTHPGEARGIVRAARAVDLPIGLSFTVETDGRLPDGTPLGDAIEQVDATDPPDFFGVNCAHPTHVAVALATAGRWCDRVVVMRCNASAASHAELDEATELDEGDPRDFAVGHAALADGLPGLRVLGGCCGTDARHVAALWDELG